MISLEPVLLLRVLEKMEAASAMIRQMLDIKIDSIPVPDASIPGLTANWKEWDDKWSERWCLANRLFVASHGLSVRTGNAIHRIAGQVDDSYKVAVLGKETRYPGWDRDMRILWAEFTRGTDLVPEYDEWLAGVGNGTQNARLFRNIGKMTEMEIREAALRLAARPLET